MKKYVKIMSIIAAAVLVSQAPAVTWAGTWMEDGDGWYCEEDGKRVTGRWVKGQGGTLYYLNEAGRMAVECLVPGDQERLYCVDETGARVKNAWRQFPAGDQEDDRDYWYYFNANGEALKGKKVIDGKKYFFDQDSRMMTGWISWSDREAGRFTGNLEDKDGDVYYCLESGEAASGWLELDAPSDENEAVHTAWYNFDGGKVRTNAKEGLDGHDYIFKKNGEMVTGWAYDDDGVWQAVNEDTDNSDLDRFKMDVTKFYYAGEDGALIKNQWVEVRCYDGLTGDGDEDKSWYYFDKKGRMAGRQATATPSDAMAVAETAGGEVRLKVHKGNKGKYEVKTGEDIYNEDAPVVAVRKVDGKYYMFNTKGKLADGLIYVPKSLGRFNQGYYNYDDKSALKTGAVVLEDGGTDYYYYFATEKDKGFSLGQGVTGIFKGRLYFEGLAVTAEEGTGWQAAFIEPREGRKISGLFLVDETGKVKTGGTVMDENGIQFKVAKKQGQDPGKKGYIITFRDKDDGFRGHEGYELVTEEDQELVPLRPDSFFQFSEEDGRYYPEGAGV